MWILLLLGEEFYICQLGQVVNCVFQMFCILTDFSLYFFLFYQLLKKCVKVFCYKWGFSIFSFNFIKFCFVYLIYFEYILHWFWERES